MAVENATMQPIKLGQLGVGHAHAAGKMEVYRRSPEFEVLGVAEPDEELRRRAQADPVYADLRWMTPDDLLALPGLEAVAIETRVRDSLTAAEAAVAAGKHVHLDKPAGQSLGQFRRLLAEAERKHLAVQLGYMYRYNPAVVQLRRLLDQGALGDVFEVHAVMSKVIGQPARQGLAEYPGGMMFELGCHLIDLVVVILGTPEQTTSFAQHAATFDDNLADNMLAVLRYSRALASVKSSALEVEGFARRHLTVCGTLGTAHIQPLDAPALRLALARGHGPYRAGIQEVPYGDYPRYVGDAADLARVIRGVKDSDFPYAHELAVQETLLAACGLGEEPLGSRQ